MVYDAVNSMALRETRSARDGNPSADFARNAREYVLLFFFYFWFTVHAIDFNVNGGESFRHNQDNRIMCSNIVQRERFLKV